MPKFMDHVQALSLIQEYIDSRDWWLMPVADHHAAKFACEIADRFYGGRNRRLFKMLLISLNLPDAPFLYLVLASKRCMSPDQLAKVIGVPLADATRDAVIPSSTPKSVVLWLGGQFRWNSE